MFLPTALPILRLFDRATMQPAKIGRDLPTGVVAHAMGRRRSGHVR